MRLIATTLVGFMIGLGCGIWLGFPAGLVALPVSFGFGVYSSRIWNRLDLF